MSKRLFISHIDLDGLASIFLALFFNKKLKFNSFLSRDYDFLEDEDEMKNLLSYDEVIMSDLSISKEHLDYIRSKNIHIEIYDHHDSAKFLGEEEYCIYDGTRSGTKIFWEDYIKPRVKRYPPLVNHFVKLVDTYDLWKTEDPLWEDAKNLNSVLYGIKNYKTQEMYEQNKPFFKLMDKKFKRYSEWVLLDKERNLIKRAQKREQYIYNKARETMEIRIDSKDRVFGLFAVPSKISLVASRILEEEPNIDYLIIVNTWGGITGKLSFRTKKDFDLNDLSVAHGHTVAAGGVINPDLAKKFLEESSLTIAYNEDYDEKNEKTALKKV